MARQARHSPNWGGRRAGAGRKPNPPVLFEIDAHHDPKQFLLAVMNRADLDKRLRFEAAQALMPYMHTRPADTATKSHVAVPPRLASTDPQS